MIINEQRATVYSGAKGFCAYPSDTTTAGFFLDSGPFIAVENKTAGAVGAAIRKGLSASRQSVPTPSRDFYGALSKSRLEAAGVRSEIAFMHGARMISVVKNDLIAVTPYKNGGASGTKRGFEAIQAKKISLPATAADVALGDACLHVLDLCE